MACAAVALAALFGVVHSSRGTRMDLESGDRKDVVLGPQAEDKEVLEAKEVVEAQEVVEAKPIRIKVKAYWMRHGASCANVLQMQAEQTKMGEGKMHGFKFTMYRDPPLTDCAIHRAKALGPMVWDKIMEDNPDMPGGKPLVFSSEMVRAQETALHNFPAQAVFPIPYIAEHGVMYDNKPQESVAEQNRAIKQPAYGNVEPTGAELASLVVYMDQVNPVAGRIVGGKDKSNYANFKKNFPDIIAKLTLGGRLKDGDTLPVIIVGHSGFMRDELECELRTPQEIKAKKDRKKPKNNEVWLQEYTTLIPDGEKLMDRAIKKWTVSMEPGACTPLFPRETFPEWPSIMCEKDIGRCARNRFPDALIRRDTDACQDLPICAGQ